MLDLDFHTRYRAVVLTSSLGRSRGGTDLIACL